MVSRALAASLFFVPACRTLAEHHGRLVELEADKAAVIATGSEKGLAGALLLFASGGPVVGAGIGAERVEALAGKRQRFALPLGLFAASLASSAMVGAIAFLAGVGGPHRDGPHLPGLAEQTRIPAPALSPLALGAPVLACAVSL